MSTITGTIGGTSVEGHVRELHRRGQLCAPGQSVILNLATSFPADIDTAMEVSLQELDTQTFTGYVVKATRERPSYNWNVECQDTYTRVASFFIENKMVTGYDDFDQPIPGYVPQSTDYWIGWLMGLCGMSYNIRDVGRTVPAGVQMGLRTVHESLMDVLAFSSQYAFPDEYGVLQIGRAVRGASVLSLSELEHYERRVDDEFTRTDVKVFGYAGFNGRVFAEASTTVPNIVPNRITAVSSPMIGTADEAQRLANYLINELGAETTVVTGTIQGDPAVKIGKFAHMTHAGYNDIDVITSLETDWTEAGYLMQVTIGERCPRIAGWSNVITPIYAGTTKYGIYKSTNYGNAWTDFNVGLPAGNKYVKRLAFNASEEGMAIVNGSLWHYNISSGSWESRSLPAPINMAGDVPAVGHGALVAVDSMGVTGQFSVLTTNGNNSSGSSQQSRSWIYECVSGGSSPAAWSSTQLSTESSGYHTIGLDLSSAYGAPYALVSSGSIYVFYPTPCQKVTITKNSLNKISYSIDGVYPDYAKHCISPVTEGPTDWDVVSVTQYDTAITITFALYHCALPDDPYAYQVVGAYGLTKNGPEFLSQSGRVPKNEGGDYYWQRDDDIEYNPWFYWSAHRPAYPVTGPDTVQLSLTWRTDFMEPTFCSRFSWGRIGREVQQILPDQWEVGEDYCDEDNLNALPHAIYSKHDLFLNAGSILFETECQ